MSAAVAGALSFMLFGISALMRDLAGRWSAAGVSTSLLVVLGLGLAAAGLVLLGQGRSVGLVAVAIALVGVGLSLPYPHYYDAAERVLPDHPIGGLGLLQVGAGIFPIPVVPLFGAALASGDADLAFGALAAFTVLTGALNARRAGTLPALALADPLLADPGEVHRRLDDLLLGHLAVEVPPVGERLHRTDHLLGDHLDELGQLREVEPLALGLLAHQLGDRGGDLVAEAIEPEGDVGVAGVAEHDPPGAAALLDEAEERLEPGPHPRLSRLGARDGAVIRSTSSWTCISSIAT